MNVGKVADRDFHDMLRAVIFTGILFLTNLNMCFASSVVLQWDPNTDTDLSGYKVYYQVGSSSQPFQIASRIDANNPTTATIGGLDPAYGYNFAVTAYDTSGAESAYSNILSISELVSPVVSITSPSGNATVSGTVSVIANASDNVGVDKVEFYVNGILQATDTSTPYQYSWNSISIAAGSYTLMAKAYDAAGNVGQSANIAVDVVKDTSAPIVSVTGPSKNATVSGSAAITASATDNIGVTIVEFYVNKTLCAVTNMAPYSYKWQTMLLPNGSYTLSSKAYDTSGNVGLSNSVAVKVSNSLSSALGDINGDGRIDISDALTALKASVGLIQLTSDQILRGDIGPIVNSVHVPDGKINIQDSLEILRVVVGLKLLQ